MLNLPGLLLPALFPSWRFFEEIGPSPRIEVRKGPNDTWRALSPVPERLTLAQLVWRLVHNPTWNAHLYRVSTAIRLEVEPDPHLEHELSRLIADALPGDIGATFQYRVVYLARENGRIGQFIAHESGHLPVLDPR